MSATAADDRTDPFAAFGVSRVLNASGTLTRLGGAIVAPEVAAAMAAAAQASVDIVSLQTAACRAIVRATGAEAGMVTTGASAALTLAAAAAIAGLDPARMQRLPHTAGLANEIVMARTHRNGYDRALQTAGAVIVDVGTNDRGTGAGIRGLEDWEVEAAIGPRTIAIAAAANRDTLGDVARLARLAERHNLPLIVDAAAQLPPKDNLRRFIAEGATLVAFSGGKAIGGPQASGILAGRRDLIASALLQQIDMDVEPGAFVAPPEFFGNARPPALPRHGIGRGFKASKEAIAGLLTALDRFAACDQAAVVRRTESRLLAMASALAGLAGVSTSILPAGKPRAYPRLALVIAAQELGLNPREVSQRLRSMTPAVYLSEERIDDGMLIIDLICIADVDDALLAASIRRSLGDP